jgi:hypothetical protein
MSNSRIIKEDLLPKQDRLKYHGKCVLMPQRLESYATNGMHQHTAHQAVQT